jgi:hypothetical protein
MKSAIDFIQSIYSQQCEDGDYLILSAKGPNLKWKDIPLTYNKVNIRKNLEEFFRQYPPNEYDLYWSPMPYSGPKRRLENALDTKFLVQDIDEYDNPEKLNPAPSYLWESSPNKYQGIWELDRYIPEEQYTLLNKALATHIGCDDCFDFCHVYRIPGTINHKYKNNPQVQLPTETKKIYKPKNLTKLLKVPGKKEEPVSEAAQGANLTERRIYAKYSIPQKIRDLLALDDLSGLDRSSTIWFVENKLHELGMTPNEIIYLVKNSIFNKYKGRKDEDKRLRQELNKIISGDISPKEMDGARPLKVSSFGTVMGNSNTFEGWLVKGFWGRRSHGIVAGMPKCFKSTLVHDLVISVASGKPFLGKFPVLDPGPVIVVQNENADYVMKDRTEKLLLHKELQGKVETKRDSVFLEFPKDLPISFINQQGFILTNPEHRQALESLIKQEKPVLVVLDPLYLMFDGDLNSAKDLNPVLNWLLYLKNEYKTSVMLIHHYNKGGTGAQKGGSRMMGSIILYGWVESAWYLSKEEAVEETKPLDSGGIDRNSTDPATITMAREFRMSGAYPEIDIHLAMGEMGNPYYDADVTLSGQVSVKKGSIKDDIVNLLNTTTSSMTRRSISETLGISRDKVKTLMDELLAEKRIITDDKGFAIYRNFGG